MSATMSPGKRLFAFFKSSTPRSASSTPSRGAASVPNVTNFIQRSLVLSPERRRSLTLRGLACNVFVFVVVMQKAGRGMMEQPRNPARARLAQGGLALGMGVRFARTAEIARMMRAAGYDWLF